MPENTNKFLLSDANALRRIKFAQFRSQVPALLLLTIAIAMNSFFRESDITTPALILAVIAVAWYLFVGLCHRFKQRIPMPPQHSLVSPIQGKIKFVRSNQDVTLLHIHKIILDSVEIRSPHADCRLEDGVLQVESLSGKISFRFDFKKIQWLSDPDFRTGNIIGFAFGAGGCTISFPFEPALLVKESDPVDAGYPILANIATLQDKSTIEPAPKPQFLIDGFMDEDEITPED